MKTKTNFLERVAQNLNYKLLCLHKSLSLREYLLCFLRERKTKISVRGKALTLSIPNWLCCWRAKTFLTKEKETMQWIDTFFHGAVFWDIGANTGNYSVYAAKFSGARTYSFEPSVFNLEVLAKNIAMNKLQKKICIIPLAIGSKTGCGMFHMSTTEWGGAFSSIHQAINSTGGAFKPCFRYQTVALTLDEVVSKLYLPEPDYIKIDVDGLEHLVLRGGTRILRKVKSLLVEMTSTFQQQSSAINRIMAQSGFIPSKAEDTKNDLRKTASKNIIWIKKG